MNTNIAISSYDIMPKYLILNIRRAIIRRLSITKPNSGLFMVAQKIRYYFLPRLKSAFIGCHPFI